MDRPLSDYTPKELVGEILDLAEDNACLKAACRALVPAQMPTKMKMREAIAENNATLKNFTEELLRRFPS